MNTKIPYVVKNAWFQKVTLKYILFHTICMTKIKKDEKKKEKNQYF